MRYVRRTNKKDSIPRVRTRNPKYWNPGEDTSNGDRAGAYLCELIFGQHADQNQDCAQRHYSGVTPKKPLRQY